MNIEGRRRNPAEILEREELWEFLEGPSRENHQDFAAGELQRTVSLNAAAFLNQSRRDPEGLRKRLHALWDLVSKRYDPEFCAASRPSDFYNETVILDNYSGVLIYMPPVRAYGEALFVLILVAAGPDPDNRAYRYLTAELGRTPDGYPVVGLWESAESGRVFIDLVEGPEYADSVVMGVRDALARESG